MDRILKYILFLAGLIFFSCAKMQNFPATDHPVFFSNEYVANIPDAALTVVSFNIKHAEEIDLAISELRGHQIMKNLDILLLQELDENGVIKIADVFKLNYVYYPMTRSNKYFGNAILSKFPISNIDKTILPHEQKNGRLRNATNCSITIGDKDILIYSAHTATITAPLKKRKLQIQHLINDVQSKEKQYDAVIIGGDLNTLMKGYKKFVKKSFSNAAFKHATQNIGYTSQNFGKIIKPENDYIYFKGLTVKESGKMTNSKASDHLPIYATFEWP